MLIYIYISTYIEKMKHIYKNILPILLISSTHLSTIGATPFNGSPARAKLIHAVTRTLARQSIEAVASGRSDISSLMALLPEVDLPPRESREWIQGVEPAEYALASVMVPNDQAADVHRLHPALIVGATQGIARRFGLAMDQFIHQFIHKETEYAPAGPSDVVVGAYEQRPGVSPGYHPGVYPRIATHSSYDIGADGLARSYEIMNGRKIYFRLIGGASFDNPMGGTPDGRGGYLPGTEFVPAGAAGPQPGAAAAAGAAGHGYAQPGAAGAAGRGYAQPGAAGAAGRGYAQPVAAAGAAGPYPQHGYARPHEALQQAGSRLASATGAADHGYARAGRGFAAAGHGGMDPRRYVHAQGMHPQHGAAGPRRGYGDPRG